MNSDGDDLEKYEQIRSIASRHWLKPSSVSLAKLDQVKARVYNLGLADKRNLKSGPSSAQLHSARSGQQLGVGSILQLETQPPLSNLTSQKHAWGSNTSIPDLIRQQSERQKKNRPESAKVSRITRPPSGRKPRPQSAKEASKVSTYVIDDPATAGKPPKPSIAIKGAQYKPGERPPEGTRQHHGGMGWAAPPAGVDDLTERALDAALQEVINSQFELDSEISRCTAATSEYSSTRGISGTPSPPAPPCGSPDFMQMIDKEQSVNGDGSDHHEEIGRLVNDLLDQSGSGGELSQRSRGPPVLLRRPTPEPIHFSLPTATLEPEAGEEEEEVTARPHKFKKGRRKIKKNEAISKTKLDINLVIGSENDIESDGGEDTEEENEEKRKAEKDASPRRNLHVKFAEDKNQTLNITPRERPFSARVVSSKLRGRSGKPELRYVKSRTDSGIVPQVQSTDRDGTSQQRPGTSKSRVNVANIGVEYLEDETEQGEDNKNKKKKEKKAPVEVETVISQMQHLDDEKEHKANENGNLFGIRNVSLGINRNYYAMTTQHANVTKTTKTLQFSEGGLIEDKKVSDLGQHTVQVKTLYVAPRPLVRPQSATKQQQPVLNKPTSGLTSTLSTRVTDTHPPRPASRVGFSGKRIERKKEKKNTEQLEVKRDEQDVSGKESLAETGNTSLENEDKTDADNAEMSGMNRSQSEPLIQDTEVATSLFDVQSDMEPKPRGQQGGRNAHIIAHLAKRNNFVNAQKPASAPPTRTYASYNRPASRSVSAGRNTKEKSRDVIEIWTRPYDAEIETESVKECRALQDKLLDHGVPVALETLTRALLPPTEGFRGGGYSIRTTSAKPQLPANTSGLISKPSLWLPREHKRVQSAKKLVREATEQLLSQQAEERRLLQAQIEGTTSTKKKKKKKRRSKSAGKTKK